MTDATNKKSFSAKAWTPVLLYVLLATTAVGFYSWNSTRFVPTIHDEQAYLFQARTFLLGRTVNPVHPDHLFFDQYHLINEKVYASKYFPGYAATLVPFVLLGVPYLNPLFFYGLQLILIFLLAKELFDRKTAWLSMVLVSFSPQIVYQACMLLGHLSCSVFLLFFYYAFIQSEKSETTPTGWMMAGASALGMAFLIRPVTAIGFAFPIGFYVLYRMYARKYTDGGRRALCWAAPLLLAGLVYGVYNYSVTGSFLKSPFDYYAQIHAPYHRYGFDTWTKYAVEGQGARVDRWFNEFYHNHTPLIGLEFMGLRLGILMEFLFGSSLIALPLLALWLIHLRKRDPRDWMIFSVFLSLQLVHVPHWYPGILTFGSNYLYEATGLVLIALSRTILDDLSWVRNVKFRPIVLGGLVFVCAVMSSRSMIELSPYMFGGKAVKIWLDERLAAFSSKPKLVFVRYPKHYNVNYEFYIDNVPTLDGPVVYAHDRGRENVGLAKYFPGREYYLWIAKPANLIRLESAPPPAMSSSG